MTMGRATQLSDGTERRDRPRALAVGQLELHPSAPLTTRAHLHMAIVTTIGETRAKRPPP